MTKEQLVIPPVPPEQEELARRMAEEQQAWLEWVKDKWGTDVAIRKRYPSAYFVLYDNKIIEWWDPEDRPAPTWEQLLEWIDEDRISAERVIEGKATE
jgi:hypothetical protein